MSFGIGRPAFFVSAFMERLSVTEHSGRVAGGYDGRSSQSVQSHLRTVSYQDPSRKSTSTNCFAPNSGGLGHAAKSLTQTVTRLRYLYGLFDTSVRELSVYSRGYDKEAGRISG